MIEGVLEGKKSCRKERGLSRYIIMNIKREKSKVA